MTTPKDKAEEIVDKMMYEIMYNCQPTLSGMVAKQCALIAVDYIITSNPHSNPLNTDVYSTMDYWQEVKSEIEKL